MSGPPPPCDWQTTRHLVKERGQYLLETGIWSDCSFRVGSEPNQQVLEGHKLFLAMSSPVFAAMFFGGMAEKDPAAEPIAILDVQPDAFKALLEYIYTDKINLTSFDQACELCYCAKKYMLPNLVQECTTYLWSDLYPKNACRAYEFAKLFEEPSLMEKCIRIICSQTQKVLTETSFEEVELSTILMLFDQDELNINSELELFAAIARYAGRHNQVGHPNTEAPNSPGQPTVRDAIKKIRFLTLSPQQFAEGPGKSTLLSESEKFSILMNICSPSAGTRMPEGFSVNTRKRKLPEQYYNPLGFNSGVGLDAISPMDTSRTSMIKFSALPTDGAVESPRKMTCTRTIQRTTECMNTSVLDCAVTFTCDKNICVYGIQVPAQVPMDEERQQQVFYPELLYAHLLDAEGSRLTYTHFTGRVNYCSLIEISFNRPVYIQRNKVYKIGVVLNKIGCYPIGTYASPSFCNGVTFTFSQGQGGDSVRDGLIRSIIFSMPPVNNSMNSNPGISGLPGDHSMQPNII